MGDRDDKYAGECNNHACLPAVPPTDFARQRCVLLHISRSDEGTSRRKSHPFCLVVTALEPTHLRARLSRAMPIAPRSIAYPAIDLPNYYVADLRVMMIDTPLVCQDTNCAWDVSCARARATGYQWQSAIISAIQYGLQLQFIKYSSGKRGHRVKRRDSLPAVLSETNGTPLIYVIAQMRRIHRLYRRELSPRDRDGLGGRKKGARANFVHACTGVTSRSYYADSRRQVQHCSLSPRRYIQMPGRRRSACHLAMGPPLALSHPSSV